MVTLFMLRIELWANSVQSAINKTLANSGWNFKAETSSGYLFSTLYFENVRITNNDGTAIHLDKMSFNVGIIRTIFNDATLDLLTAEGGRINHAQNEKQHNKEARQPNIFKIPFNVRSFFVDSNIKTFINDNQYNFDVMIGGELNGFEKAQVDCDLLKISIGNNKEYVCKLDNIILKTTPESYYFEELNGTFFGLPVKGKISLGRFESKLAGKINVKEFNFPKELFSKLPLKTKFSKFKGELNFESDFEKFNGELKLENSLGLDMLGNFKLQRNANGWIIDSLELSGERSKLFVNGLWEKDNRLNCFMDLKNLDLSAWMNNQNSTSMSGLFIFDAGFTKKGALDKINMNLEIVESRLFNQGEISVHGQLFYSDSVITTIDPVMLLVGDSYLTIDGRGDFKTKHIDFFTDMEKADIDLFNSFLPGNFLGGKATGSLKVSGNVHEPSAVAELTCENVTISDFNIQSIELNSRITVVDSIPSGYVDIKAGKGEWMDRGFDTGTLGVLIDDKAFTVENFHFKSGNDFLQASGRYDGISEYEIDRVQLAFDDDYLINAKPLSLSFHDSLFQMKPFELHINDGLLEGVISGGVKRPEGRVKMSNFDAEILTQFLDDDRLKFSGLVFGEVWFKLINDKFEIDTDFSLKKGHYMGAFFDEMIFSVLLKDDILHIDDISMSRRGEMGFQASGTVPIKNNIEGPSNIALKTMFSNISLKLVHRFIPKFFDIDGEGTGNVRLSGTLNKTEIDYQIQISNASFDLIKLGDFSSLGTYDGNRLYVEYAKSTSDYGNIFSSGYLPYDLNIGSKNFSKFHKENKLDFTTTASVNTLPFLSPYIDNLDSAEGIYNIELSLHGNSDNIMRDGNITIQNGKLHTLLFADPIQSINGFAVMKNNRLEINNFDFLLYSPDDKKNRKPSENAKLQGSIDFTSFFDPDYDLKVNAEEASYKLLFLDVYGQSGLNLSITGRDTILLEGEIETQHAEVFYEFNTEDVGTLVHQENDNIMAYSLNIPIRGEAYFNNSQINAKVTGELNLSQVGNQEIDFGGQIIVEDGSVYSYTDYFTGLKGSVSFDNKGFNPDINVTAATNIGDEEIYLSMEGGINDLDIILESQNEFSESDILELLTWGKRIEDQEWTSTGFGNQTVSILGTLLENQLEKNLKDSNLGMMNYVDDIEITGAANLLKGSDENFEVTTKTQVSEKAFINLSYKRSFSLNQPRVGVEYKLNRHFSVVGNVDDQGKLNLKYRYRYAY